MPSSRRSEDAANLRIAGLYDQFEKAAVHDRKHDVKLTMIGDGTIGKTCLLRTMDPENENFAWDDDETQDYEPTTFNNFTIEWHHPNIKGEVVCSIWDTAGQETFEHLRKLTYPGTDILLLGYSCSSKVSLRNIPHKWMPEVKEQGIDPWIIVVGTKCDLQRQVDLESAEHVAGKINACAWIETSAKTGVGMKELKQMVKRLSFLKLQGKPRPNFGEDSMWNVKHVQPRKAWGNVAGYVASAGTFANAASKAYQTETMMEDETIDEMRTMLYDGSPDSRPSTATRPSTAKTAASELEFTQLLLVGGQQ